MEDKLWWFSYPGSDCYPASWPKKRGPKKTMRKKENLSQADTCFLKKKKLTEMNLTFDWVLTQLCQLLALTAMDNSSCSFCLPKGCTHQSMLLPETAIQTSCSSCSYTVLHELHFMSMQFMSFSLTLGFSLWNFSSSSMYVSPKFDLISDYF